ncbi:DUF6020 family protein [Ruminococcus sp.]|uniref:DUF6020 family protein n=2 Tax=Ruminococcus sp. TaxID=41978 RepID=UPI002CE73A40|nr:DUF6020 family protein [Ruminococcus sp.]HOH86268.1 DUF6020 family protein [Ruminococcus sp.]
MKSNNTTAEKKPKSLTDLKWIPYLLSAMGAIAFSQFFNFKTSNIFTLIFAILMFPIFRRRYSTELKLCKSSCLCSLILSLFTVASSQIDNINITESFSKLENFSSYIPSFVMFFLFYEALTYLLYQKLSGISLSQERAEPGTKGKLKVFFGSMAVMLLMWLPISLFLYPAVITEDSIWQLQQAMGQTELTNHHPVLHTMIIRGTFSLGQWLFDGDDTKSVLVYTITQQLFLSGCFAYLTETLYKSKVKRSVIVFSLLFYVIPAYHAAYSATMWKDVWFGGIVAVISSLIWRLLCKEKKFRLSVSEAILLFVFSLGMCLMRSNGLYAFVLLFIAALIVFLRRSKLTVAVMAAALAAAFVIKGPVYSAAGVKPVDNVESLSIPLQQISYVVKYSDDLTPEEKELVEQVIDIDKLRDSYRNSISDPIKNLIREKGNQNYITEHKSEYFRLWLDLGLRHPGKYVKAFINQTCGYWFPDVQYWVTSTSCLSDGFEIDGGPRTGVFTDFLMFYLNSYIETPFLGLLWSIGAGIWVMVFMLGAAFRRHRRSIILVYLPVIGIWLTLLIATPVHSEFRYIYSLFTAMPLFCMIPFLNNPIGRDNAEAEKEVPAAEAEKPEESEPGQADTAEKISEQDI